jgi:MFS family permease
MMLIFAPTSSIWVGKFGNKRVVATGLGIVAISLLLVSGLTPGTPTVLIIGATMVMGVGMANIMAPATDSIMGSLPRAKAGVGSAVNDTTRQTGGAFGVAVLGSLLASRYSGEITRLLGTHIAPEVKDNVAAAHGYALKVLSGQPDVQQRIIDASNHAFVSGFHMAAIAGACVIAATALAVLKFLPARGDEMGSGVPHDAQATADISG